MGTRIPLSTVEWEEKNLREKLDMSTAEIGLSVRTTNCLEERGIFTVRDLLGKQPKELLAISNFGEKTLEEVYRALEGIGFYRPWRRPPEKTARRGSASAASSRASAAPERASPKPESH